MSYQHLTLAERFTLYESRMVLKESLSTIPASLRSHPFSVCCVTFYELR
jgi:hypothetical protein